MSTRSELLKVANEHGWTNSMWPDRQVFTRGREEVTVFYGEDQRLTRVHVGEHGGSYGIMVGNLKRERTREILALDAGRWEQLGAKVNTTPTVCVDPRHNTGDDLATRIAKLARQQMAGTWDLHPGVIERHEDGSVTMLVEQGGLRPDGTYDCVSIRVTAEREVSEVTGR